MEQSELEISQQKKQSEISNLVLNDLQQKFTQRIRNQNRQEFICQKRIMANNNSHSHQINTSFEQENNHQPQKDIGDNSNLVTSNNNIYQTDSELQQFLIYDQANYSPSELLHFCNQILQGSHMDNQQDDSSIMKFLIPIRKISIQNGMETSQLIEVPNVIHYLINLVCNSDKKHIKYESLTILSSLAAGNHSQCRVIVQAGVINLFMQTLNSICDALISKQILQQIDREILWALLWGLGNLVGDSLEHRNQICAMQAFPKLYAIIKMELDQINEQAQLLNLTPKDQMYKSFIERQADSNLILSNSVWTFSNMCRDSAMEQDREQIFTSDTILLFAQVIYSFSTGNSVACCNLLYDAAEGLQYLVQNNLSVNDQQSSVAQKMKTIADSNIIYLINYIIDFKYASYDAHQQGQLYPLIKSVLEIYTTLIIFSLHDPVMMNKLLSSLFFKPINTLINSTIKLISQHAVKSLLIIVSSANLQLQTVQLMIDESIMNSIFANMRQDQSPYSEVRKCCLKLVRQILLVSSANQTYSIMPPDRLDILGEMLLKSKDADYLKIILDIFYLLLKTEKENRDSIQTQTSQTMIIYTVELEKRGIVQYIEKLQKSDNKIIYETSLNILEKFFETESCYNDAEINFE